MSNPKLEPIKPLEHKASRFKDELDICLENQMEMMDKTNQIIDQANQIIDQLEAVKKAVFGEGEEWKPFGRYVMGVDLASGKDNTVICIKETCGLCHKSQPTPAPQALDKVEEIIC